jgi:hypothetical protein
VASVGFCTLSFLQISVCLQLLLATPVTPQGLSDEYFSDDDSSSSASSGAGASVVALKVFVNAGV